MADNSLESRGTELFLSPDGTTVIKFVCPTGITGIGYTTNQNDTSCLDSMTATSRPGQKTLQPVTVPFLWQDGEASHELVMSTLKDVTTEYQWVVGLSNGVDDPTMVGNVLTLPTTRSGFTFTGYISSLNIDINNGDLVRGQFQINVSSNIVPQYKV